MSFVLILIACAMFLLTAFGVQVGGVALGWLGMTFFAAGILAGAGWPWTRTP